MTTIKVIPKEVHIGALKIADVCHIKLRNIVIRELSIDDNDGWAQVYHDLYDLEDDLIASRDMKIEGEIYANWGLDDHYLINFILGAYGLERYPDEWIEPDGVQPPYNTDDKVAHNDEIWISLEDENVEEPTEESEEWEKYL